MYTVNAANNRATPRNSLIKRRDLFEEFADIGGGGCSMVQLLFLSVRMEVTYTIPEWNVRKR